MAVISFLGATETVTGSKYLLEAGNSRLLVDCGLFQGLKELRLRNWAPLPIEPATIDAVVLTHAHIDHTGYLPRLVRDGFRGPVYCTAATAELTELLLFDSAENQEEDTRYANRKGYSKHHPALPLYTPNDAARAVRLLRQVPRGEWFQPAGSPRLRFQDAGHLLGSSSIELHFSEAPNTARLVFSGDVGRYDAPLYRDPAPPPECEYLVCESTYGNREHPPESVLDQLRQVVLDGMRRGGVMIVPAFAVGRSQQLVYLLQVLIALEQIPALPIFVDSPMAVDATNIYRSYAEEHDLQEFRVPPQKLALHGKTVKLVRTPTESKRLNALEGPAIIISSSGMMVGGRVLHHLRQRLPNPRNTIVLGGFMAEGTRGRRLQDGAKTLRMHGMDIPVKAAIVELSGLSGHAGRSELLRWLAPLPPPRHTFITHGEKRSAEDFAQYLRQERQWLVTVPSYGSRFTLDETR